MWAGDSRYVCRHKAREEGMSLLEVLVSVALILLTVPFMVVLEIGALKLNGDAGELDLAMWAAQAKVEELRAVGYAGVANGQDEYTLPDGRVVTREWTVRNSKPVTSTKTIAVVAFVRDRVDARQARIDFVLAGRSTVSGSGGKDGGSEDDDGKDGGKRGKKGGGRS